MFGFQVEQRDSAGPLFGHQDAVLTVDFRVVARVRRWHQVPRHFRRFRVDPAEIALGEFDHPRLVLESASPDKCQHVSRSDAVGCPSSGATRTFVPRPSWIA
jgi:hypothetical protein